MSRQSICNPSTRKREAFERWMDSIWRRLTAQEEEDAARNEYSAADDAYSIARQVVCERISDRD